MVVLTNVKHFQMSFEKNNKLPSFENTPGKTDSSPSPVLALADTSGQLEDLNEEITSRGYSFEYDEQIDAIPKIIEKIKAVCIFFVKDGVVKTAVLTKHELEKLNRIHLDGYIAGMLVFTDTEKGEVHIECNDTYALEGERLSDRASVGVRNGCRITYIYPEDLNLPSRYQDLFNDLMSQVGDGVSAYFVGNVATSIFYLGESVGHELHGGYYISFADSKSALRVGLEQSSNDYIGSLGSTDFYFLGNNKNLLKSRVIGQKLSAIHRGIRKIEKFAGKEFVNKVNIVEFNVNNAMANKNSPEIKFTTANLLESTPYDLRNMAEHELLHKYVDHVGLNKDEHISTLLAQTLGRDSWGAYGDFAEYDEHAFFAFVNEHNYLDTSEGGHSNANIDEFSTSFLHSLMYIDKFEKNLEEGIRLEVNDKNKTYLTTEEKLRVIDLYILFTLAFRDATRNTSADVKPFRKKQAEIFYKKAIRKLRKLRVKYSS